MQLTAEGASGFKSLVTISGAVVFIAFVLHLLFAGYTSYELGIGGVLTKAIFFFAMTTVAPFIVLTSAVWHVIPATIVVITFGYFVAKKINGWKRIILLAVAVLVWQLYGAMCLTSYVGA